LIVRRFCLDPLDPRLIREIRVRSLRVFQ